MNYTENRGLFKFILLTPLTLGLYAIYFWYSYARDVNLMCDGDGKHTTHYIIVLLLTPLTLGIYPLIWVKNMQDRLRNRGNEKGCNITQNGGTIVAWYTFGWLLFGVGPLIGLYQQISTINQVALALNRSPGAPTHPVPAFSATRQNLSASDVSSAISYAATFSPVSAAPDAPAAQKPVGSVMCPKCHEIQRINRIVCQRCGAVLPRMDAIGVPSGNQETPSRPAERPMAAPATQGAVAERAPYNVPAVSAYPGQSAASMQARYMQPATQTGDVNSRHRRTLPPDGAPLAPEWQDGRAAQDANRVRVPGREVYPSSLSTMDQRQIIHTQEGMMPATEQREGNSFEKSVRVYQQRLTALVQTLPEPKPVYLWTSLAVSGLMSVIALLVAIFR